jgi:hypothetical protein
LERLRDENTQVKSKAKGGIVLKATLRPENTQLKNKDTGDIVLKVGEKGTVCMYGIGQSAVTLNKEQWLRILASASEIRAFIGENDSKLITKE